ncbi:UNVERIFIED_CONTAM: hypothetical protein Scaly_1216800 [Sesamum calycinum]|uniref:Uncharacterized protein n=1 Tax=Sesamum calycinum TaxID=2727403 RepID=A0AAW2Q4C9_9LAMI
MIPVPAGEEVAPKLVRLLYFVGAGVLCTAGINKWKDLERKAMIQKQQQLNGPSVENPSDVEVQITMPLAYHEEHIDQQNRNVYIKGIQNEQWGFWFSDRPATIGDCKSYYCLCYLRVEKGKRIPGAAQLKGQWSAMT